MLHVLYACIYLHYKYFLLYFLIRQSIVIQIETEARPFHNYVLFLLCFLTSFPHEAPKIEYVTYMYNKMSRYIQGSYI